MEDEDLAMLLYSVILMNQNTRKKVNLEDFGLNPYTWKERKKDFIESSSSNEIGIQREPF